MIYERAGRHEYDRDQALRQMLSLERATSLEGAAMQIAEAISSFALIWDQFPEKSETYQIRQDCRRLNRLLFSALSVMQSQSASQLLPFIVVPKGSPWNLPEEDVERHREFEVALKARRTTITSVSKEVPA